MGAEKKLKKCIEKISVLVCRSGAEASGNAPHYSGFCSKKVRISTKRYRVQNKNTQMGIFILYLKGIRTRQKRDKHEPLFRAASVQTSVDEPELAQGSALPLDN